MLRVGERVLLLALSDDPDKHPLGYLSSRLLTDVEGGSSLVTLDCALSHFRDAPPGEKSLEPVVISDCVFRVEACMDRHDASRTSGTQRRLDVGSTAHSGMQLGTLVRYSKAIQLMHERSGALLCIDVREQLAKEGFAMKVVLKTVEPPSGAIVASDEWSDTWWELRPPGNVRISQVLLHFDEICLHSNRWHRSLRAHPAPAPDDRKKNGGTRVDRGSVDAAALPQNVSPGEIDASFAPSLLRVVPFDDYPSPPPSDDILTPEISTALSTTASSSSSRSFTSVSDPGRSSLPGGTADGGVVPLGTVIRGGDVVRFCHLTSAGFLTHEAVPTTPPRLAGGEDGNGVPEGGLAAMREEIHRGGGHFGAFLYVSTTPERRQKLQNASSNCLWVLERTHCALGGRPLRRISDKKAFQGGVSMSASQSVPLTAGVTGVRVEHGRRHSDCGHHHGLGSTLGGSGGGFAAGAPSSTGVGHDMTADDVAKLTRRQGAGDSVEYVRIKHLATMRYLCIGKKCDPVEDEGDSARGRNSALGPAPGFKAEGSKHARGHKRRVGVPRVGMVTVEGRAAVPASTVFVIRPRSAIGAAPPIVAASTDGMLGSTDLVHLQHRDTGLFMASMPRDDDAEDGRVELTVVKSPLTSEYWRITRTAERERKATNHILTALAQLKAAFKPLLNEVEQLPPYFGERSFSPLPPPVPSSRALRSTTLAVAHFHSIVARGSDWWLSKSSKETDRGGSVAIAKIAPYDGPSMAGRGLKGVGERAGRGSAVWALARGTSNSTMEDSSRRKDKAGGSFSSKSGGVWSGPSSGTPGGPPLTTISMDEFYASPTLRFQLLLREQGVIVTLFGAMEMIFRARGNLLTRTLWWEDGEIAGTFSVHNSLGDTSLSGEGASNWESRMDNAEARHCLRRLVREAMALADFFAKDNARGKVILEPFTPLLREMIGSGLGACELLATIRRDNPRTSLNITARRIQEIAASLPESRDLANSMRLLASICRVGDALLPTVQRLVAATVLVGEYNASASGEASGFSSLSSRTVRTVGTSSSSSSIAQGRSGSDGRVNSGSYGSNEADKDEKEEKGEGVHSREDEIPAGSGGVAGNRGSIAFKKPRGLFEYELLSNTGAGRRGDEDHPFSYGRSQGPWWSPDGTRGIRVKLERLVKSPSPEIQLRRLQELLAHSRASSGGEAVIFEAWLEGGGTSRTVVRVVSRDGVDELPGGRGGGAGASSAAGDLLEYFVESVKLLSTLCRERHAENIALIRKLKGTSYKELMDIVRCETVPLSVRGAFALLVERMHLDVAPLLPQPPVRYVRLKENEESEAGATDVSPLDSMFRESSSGSLEEGGGEKKHERARRVTPAVASKTASSEQQQQRERLRDALKFAEQFLYKNTRAGAILNYDRWASGEGTVEQPWESLYEVGRGGSGSGTVPYVPASDPLGRTAGVGEADTTQSRRPHPLRHSFPVSQAPNPSGASSSSASAVSKPLQLNESLQLLGAVLSMLRLTLTLLGRRPFGRGTEDIDPSPALFRRLCSLLDFLEEVRELRRHHSFNMGKTGGVGAIAGAGGGAVVAGGVSAFGRSYPTSLGVGGVAGYSSTSKLLRSLANQDAVGITDTELSVMKVLTLLLGHEVDGQIDQVLKLAALYDEEGSAFCFSIGAGRRLVATVHGDDIWTVVHRSGVGLLAGKLGETTANSLGKTLLRLAVAGQQKGRKGGPTLTARSFALLFRISNQGKQLTREARKVTLLPGHAAAETHHRLARAVVALRAFSRRRRGRPNTGHRHKNVSTPSFSQAQSGNTATASDPVNARAKGEVQRKHPVSVPSEGPLMSSSSPLSHSVSTDNGSLEETVDIAGEHVRMQSTGSLAFEAAAAAALAAEKAVKAAAAAASAAASAAEAARGAALAAEEAALAEETSIVEALEEVRTALAAGQKDAAGAGAEVERVAAGVGLAPALLGVLRALGIEGGSLGEGTAAGRTGQLAADVMDLLRLLVEAGPNAELRRLLFSNFSLLISFLKVDVPPVHDASPGGRRLFFAGPVSRLMGAVVNGDLSLMTSITAEHLTQLARKAARSREIELLKLLQKFVTCNEAPVTSMQRRVLVTLLRELSLTDFHAAFGWEPTRMSLFQRQDSQRSEAYSTFTITSALRSESGSLGPSVPPDDRSAWTRRETELPGGDPLRRQSRMFSWGASSEPVSYDSEFDQARGESKFDFTTSGLEFMAALQRALVSPKQGGVGGADADAGTTEHHAFVLLQVIAACCEGKNHFTEVQCRSMVSLEDLVALITRGPPPGSRSRPEFDEEEEKGEVGDADPALAGLGAANPGSERQSGAKAPQPSSWFRARPASEGDDEDDTRPFSANVRWVLLWLLDSLFFTVKEPIEGLDRHPAVHALLEYLLTTAKFCVTVPASKRWESEEIDFLVSDAAMLLHNFFAECWRDPLPLVAKTARRLVSKLAVLFHSLADDVRIIAENAGLEWRCRDKDGIVVDEGTWVGTCNLETRKRLERRKHKLKPLRDLIFELYLSGDRRKRDLFSLFQMNHLRTRRQGIGDVSSVGPRGGGRARADSADAVRTHAESTDVFGRGRANSADIEGAGTNEEHFRDVFRVIQELDMIAEDSPSTFQDERPAHAADPAQEGDQTGETKDGVSPAGPQARESPGASRGAPGTGEGGGSVRTRSVVRAGSVRYPRRRSSGGSSGFYRDLGNIGDDNWQSITGSAPDLAPRLPIEWTKAHTQLSESPQHLAPTVSVLGGDGPGVRDSGGDGFPSRSLRNISGASITGAGGGGGTGLADNVLGGLSRGVSSREGMVVGEASDDAVVEGPAAAAAASALLYGTGWPGGSNVSSKSFAIRREIPSGKWSSGVKASGTRSRAGRLGDLPRFPSTGMSSRLASFVTKDEDDNAPRLQLSEHAALPLLEASVASNGEIEALVADLRKLSRDESVQALIAYVCSPPLDSENDDSALIGGGWADGDYPERKSAADAGPEIALKRFGLQILRAIIDTTSSVGDGSESLPGIWQAGGGQGSGIGNSEGRRGRQIDEERPGRQEQQERIARLGGGSTILLFVGGLSSSSTSDTAADAFRLAVEMLRDGNKQVQEHFFSVLRDSREDERFFAAVTSYIRASVNRLAGARRRRILQRRRGAAERRIRRMAAAGSRRATGTGKRRRRSASVGRDLGSVGIARRPGAAGLQQGPFAVSELGSSSDTGGASTGQRGGPSNAAGAGYYTPPERFRNKPISMMESGDGGGSVGGSRSSAGSGDEDESRMDLPLEAAAGGETEETSSLVALMEFLRLLCENHYNEMQDYMRTQPDNMRSYNLVSEIAGLLQGLEWVVLEESRNWGIDSTTIDLAYTVLRTLVEFAQGNEGNKLAIATPSVASSINDLFLQSFDGRGPRDSVKAAFERGECKISPARLKNQGFVLLHSLIEGCHELSVYCTLIQTLDFEAIFKVVEEAREHYREKTEDYRLKERKYLKLRRAKWRAGVFLASKGWKTALEAATEEFKSSEERWHSARRGYSTPIVFLRALLDGARMEHPKLCEKEKSRFKDHLEQWKKHVLCIEIKRGGRLEKMYFVVPEWCWAHWDKIPVAGMREGQIRSRILKEVVLLSRTEGRTRLAIPNMGVVQRLNNTLANREHMKKWCARATSSPRWKLLKFYRHGEDMLTHIRYLHTLQATSLHLITGNEGTWSFLTFVLALAINFIDIFGSTESGDRWMQVVGIIIGGFHVVISCLRLIAFMYNRQQKWLTEKRLPDLSRLRRVLRLGPTRRGDIYGSVRPGSPPKQFTLSRLTSGGYSNHAPGETSGLRTVSASRGSKRLTRSSLAIVGKTQSINSLGGFKVHDTSSSNGSSEDSDNSEEGLFGGGGNGRRDFGRESGGRGKEVSRVDSLTRMVVMLGGSKWNALYVLVSLLGLSLSLGGYIKERSTCYAFCLLDVSVRYRAMHRVLRAVSKNWAMLWQTAMLVVVVLFVFAAVGTSLFSEDFALGLAVEAVRESDDAEDFRGCETLAECTITFFQYALRGDLGTYLYLMTDGDETGHRVKRFIFDVSYWVLVPLLLLNMVSGVILDSFAQLRDEESGLRAELKSRCVVCGISRNEFDRGGNVFYDHINNDHCMWNYVLVRAYLKDKPELEHTGQESYVHALQRGPNGTPDVSYFPIGEAGVLEGKRQGEAGTGDEGRRLGGERRRLDGPIVDGSLREW